MDKKSKIKPELSERAKMIAELSQKYRLTPEQHAETLERIIKATFNGKYPVDEPTMHIIIAQTGAGKSALTQHILQLNPNSIIVNGDNCKIFRPDAEELSKLYPNDFNAITRYDSHKHMLEVFEEVKSHNYNGIIEKAPSVNFENFWGAYTIPEHYKIEYNVMAVSELNSLISTRERYEEQILFGAKSPKLTEVARHDDSFLATQMAIEELEQEQVNVFIRGNMVDKIPIQVYPSKDFPSATDCVGYYRVQDLQKILISFPERFAKLKTQMQARNAPAEQWADLEKIYKRYLVVHALAKQPNEKIMPDEKTINQ